MARSREKKKREREREKVGWLHLEPRGQMVRDADMGREDTGNKKLNKGEGTQVLKKNVRHPPP